jgi:hypothetical protein
MEVGGKGAKLGADATAARAAVLGLRLLSCLPTASSDEHGQARNELAVVDVVLHLVRAAQFSLSFSVLASLVDLVLQVLHPLLVQTMLGFDEARAHAIHPTACPPNATITVNSHVSRKGPLDRCR